MDLTAIRTGPIPKFAASTLDPGAHAIRSAVQAVEHRRRSGDPLIVIARDRADTVDRATDAGGFVAPELVVAKIEIVDDLADRDERGIVEPHPLDQHRERAEVADVRELGIEHVEAQLAGLGYVALRGNELEPRLRQPFQIAYQRACRCTDVTSSSTAPRAARHSSR